MKFLIIDDNVGITNMLTQFLEKSKIEVTAVNNGKEGVELIQSNAFDIIFLDIAMPGFNGIEVIERLVQEKFSGFEKIIIATALKMSEAELEFLNSYGVKAIISKPFKITEIIEIIKSKKQK